jgi:hypothetical protein
LSAGSTIEAEDRSTSDQRPKKIRSAVTNGRRVFVEGDGCSPWSRRYLDLIALHADDLGGMSTLSAAQHSLCKRAATLEVELERLEGILSQGGTVDIEAYARSASHLRRILESLGIERARRDITPPSPDEWAARKAASRAPAIEAAE